MQRNVKVRIFPLLEMIQTVKGLVSYSGRLEERLITYNNVSNKLAANARSKGSVEYYELH